MNKQTIYRLWHSLRLWMITDSGARADYIKKHHIFHRMGNGCTIMERKVPLCPQLISIGNNVHLAAKVLLVPHDAIHLCLNGSNKQTVGGFVFKEVIGCIEIGDNVFIGSNSTILCNVKIGSNVIIGAGSLVNKDIPDNSVAVGNPARVIGTYDDFVQKRKDARMYPDNIIFKGHVVTKELEKWCWKDFYKRREFENGNQV